MSLAPTDATCDLVLHVLAHVPAGGEGPLSRAASVHDPRYVAWAEETLPREAVEPARQDAALLGALWARATPRELLTLAGLPFSVGEGSFSGGAAPDGEAREGLSAGAHALELVGCAVELARAAWRRAWAGPLLPLLEGATTRVRPPLTRLGHELPGLRRREVELSAVLGVRGRVSGPRIVVGAPLPWNGLAPELIAVTAAHEHAVEVAAAYQIEPPAGGAPEPRHRERESLAIAALGARLGGTAFAGAHAAWLSMHDLTDVDLAADTEAVDAVAHAL